MKSMDKAKSSSLSLPESYWIRLQEIADTEFGSNRTAAIREMIDAHQSLSEQNPISDLIARYSPLLKSRHKQALEFALKSTGVKPDENTLLHNILEQAICLVSQGVTQNFAILGPAALKQSIKNCGNITSESEVDHLVDKIILSSKSCDLTRSSPNQHHP